MASPRRRPATVLPRTGPICSGAAPWRRRRRRRGRRSPRVSGGNRDVCRRRSRVGPDSDHPGRRVRRHGDTPRGDRGEQGSPGCRRRCRGPRRDERRGGVVDAVRPSRNQDLVRRRRVCRPDDAPTAAGRCPCSGRRCSVPGSRAGRPGAGSCPDRAGDRARRCYGRDDGGGGDRDADPDALGTDRERGSRGPGPCGTRRGCCARRGLGRGTAVGRHRIPGALEASRSRGRPACRAEPATRDARPAGIQDCRRSRRASLRRGDEESAGRVGVRTRTPRAPRCNTRDHTRAGTRCDRESGRVAWDADPFREGSPCIAWPVRGERCRARRARAGARAPSQAPPRCDSGRDPSRRERPRGAASAPP